MVCGKYMTIHRGSECIIAENPAKQGFFAPKPVENPVDNVDERFFHTLYIRARL